MEFKNIPGKSHALESKTFHLYVLIADFEEWKVRFERDTNSSFVKTTGEKWSSNKTLTYYYCISAFIMQNGLKNGLYVIVNQLILTQICT